MKWLLVFLFAQGPEVRAEMTARDRVGEVQCWGIAEAVNRVAEKAGKPEYRAECWPASRLRDQ